MLCMVRGLVRSCVSSVENCRGGACEQKMENWTKSGADGCVSGRKTPLRWTRQGLVWTVSVEFSRVFSRLRDGSEREWCACCLSPCQGLKHCWKLRSAQ